MDWIKTILPLIGVLLGWFLSEKGKVFSDKRQDKRKLRKLLFLLLDLRFHFAKELSTQEDFEKYFDSLKSKLLEKFDYDENDTEFINELDNWKSPLLKLLIKHQAKNNRFEYLAENIDKILIDLAEIFPILAFELKGQHNIKERLNGVSNYFNDVDKLTSDIPFDLNQWLSSKISKELLQDLDFSIEKIAGLIDKATVKSSKLKITTRIFGLNDVELDNFIDDYLEKAANTKLL